MTQTRWRLPSAAEEVVDVALVRSRRDDQVLPGSGGPAGNARLTAWTGLVLLVLFLGELLTLLDVHGLITWHLAIGVALIPPALLKTAVTGWRLVRYYLGNQPYRTAGPPPMLLRLLGPLVVLSTLALLATGVTLVLVGADSGRQPLITVLGQSISVLTLHQGSFLVWAAATGLHVLARLLPAWRTVTNRLERVPGPRRRTALLSLSLVAIVPLVLLVLAHPGGWTQDQQFGPPGDFHGPGQLHHD